jgi:type II secretory ATPase GspE/PulE/Tfp pilus assembly ATPase PilB-like protein
MVNEEIRDIILRNGSVAEMREAAQRNGMYTLRDAGLVKVFEGTTTIEEVVRETVLDA